MKSWLSLSWQLLLALALVANPLAAASAASTCPQAHATTTVDAMPPCHERMAAGQAPAKVMPAGQRHHDCGRAGCNFGACCASWGLATIAGLAPQSVPAHAIGRGEGARALAAPTPLPLIRPPIA